MSTFLEHLFTAFSAYPHSPDFLKLARHGDQAGAFSRRRKLPLPALVAVLISGMRKSVQTELDEFFGHLEQQVALVRHVSERAFFGACAKLGAGAVPALNDWLIEKVEAAGLVPRWHGLRVVAADGSALFGYARDTGRLWAGVDAPKMADLCEQAVTILCWLRPAVEADPVLARQCANTEAAVRVAAA